MKKIGLFIIIISLLILSACSQEKIKEVDKDNTPPIEDSREIKEKETLIAASDFSSEEAIKEYLVGQWYSQIDYISDVVVSMNIDENLDLQISFYDAFTKEPRGDYKGKIRLDKADKSIEEAHKINIELDDPEYSMASFYFTHRTIYDGKRLMSMFFTEDGNFVFQKLMGDDESQYDMEELIFEKSTGESSQEKTRKNDKFYAVYWDHGVEDESIWLDDVEWEPRDYDDFESTYPRWMKRYENKKKESILYKMNPNKSFDILGDNMFKGEVYYVETDEEGNIIDLIDADYKEYMETQESNHMDPEL